MAREKPYFRETVEVIIESTGKMMWRASDIKEYLHIRYSGALEYMDGQKTITVFEFAKKLLK